MRFNYEESFYPVRAEMIKPEAVKNMSDRGSYGYNQGSHELMLTDR